MPTNCKRSPNLAWLRTNVFEPCSHRPSQELINDHHQWFRPAFFFFKYTICGRLIPLIASVLHPSLYALSLPCHFTMSSHSASPMWFALANGILANTMQAEVEKLGIYAHFYTSAFALRTCLGWFTGWLWETQGEAAMEQGEAIHLTAS